MVKLWQILQRLIERDLAQHLFDKLQSSQTALDYQTLFKASSQLVDSSYRDDKIADLNKIPEIIIANLEVQMADNTQ